MLYWPWRLALATSLGLGQAGLNGKGDLLQIFIAVDLTKLIMDVFEIIQV
jgi:hypothetical protein